MSKVLKNILKVLGIFLLAIVLLVGGFFGYLTVTEFNPKKEEKVNVSEEKDYFKELKKVCRYEEYDSNLQIYRDS